MIARSASLVHLDMSFNEVGERGAAALAHALVPNRTLRVLLLEGNAVGDAGAAAFAGVLRDTLAALSL